MAGVLAFAVPDAAEHANFQDALNKAVDFAHEDDILVVGADLNASLGICGREERFDEPGSDASRILGPYGIRHVNAAGRVMRTVLHSHWAVFRFFLLQK